MGEVGKGVVGFGELGETEKKSANADVFFLKSVSDLYCFGRIMSVIKIKYHSFLNCLLNTKFSINNFVISKVI